MKIQLVFFAAAGFFLSQANALSDGLNVLNARNLYDQINSQVRVPLRTETSGVRSVIDSMKDQLRSNLRDSQTQQQSFRGRLSSETKAPQNIRREELTQIRERQTVSSSPFSQQPSISDEQSSFNRNSQDIRRQIYQNRQQQVEKSAQQVNFINTQNPVRSRNSYNRQEQENIYNNQPAVNIQHSNENQQRYILPQRSINRKQETVAERSYKQVTVIPIQPFDDRQQTVSPLRSFNNQNANVQQSNNLRNQQDFNAQQSNNNRNQQDFSAQRSNNLRNQQDFNAQRSNNLRNQQDFNGERSNNQNQQTFNANNNQNQQKLITQRFNNNQNQQDFNAQRAYNQNQQRQFQSGDDKLFSHQVDNEGYRVAVPQENRPQIISYDLFNRNLELNSQRSFLASNQQNQAHVGHDSTNQPRKSSEGEQQQSRYEASRPLLSSENVFGQNSQNENFKFAEEKVAAPVAGILNAVSDSKRGASLQIQLKTPFTVFNNGHPL